MSPRISLLVIVVLVSLLAIVVGSQASFAQSSEGPPSGLIWLALGDSYSSGEGLRYVDQQANPPGKTCERATGNTSVNDGNGSRAYAKVAYDQLRDSWEDSFFELLACTGARSNEIHDQYRARRDTDRKADIVTVSIGGNNLGFREVVMGCVGLSLEGGAAAVAGGTLTWSLAPWVGCQVQETELRERVLQLVNSRPGAAGPDGGQTLPDMYRELAAEAVNPGGHIFVLGYPNLVEESSRWSLWWFEGNRCSRFSRADTAMLRSATGYLNEQLAKMVEGLDAESDRHFHWIDVSQIYESETGRHGLCTGDPWINGMTVGVLGPKSGLGPIRYDRSFHPNQKGHDAAGSALADRVQQVLDQYPPPIREPRQVSSATWDEVKNAEIPGLCMHKPTQLVDGADVNPVASDEHPGGDPGYFNLVQDSLVSDLPSPVGPLTAVGAACSAGGVAWGPTIMFFSPGGQYYDSTDLWDADWDSVGLRGPGRGAARSLVVDGSQLRVDVVAYVDGDAGCCASGSGVVTIEVGSNGEIVFAGIQSGGAQSDTESAAVDRFSSPSGNIACGIQADRVVCQIAEKNWAIRDEHIPPAWFDESEPCEFDYGHEVELRRGMTPQFTCVSDVAFYLSDPDNPGTIRYPDPLPYGTATAVGPFTCTSERTGVTCWEETNLMGRFTMARDTYPINAR